MQLRNASDTVVNDPNWKTREETQDLFSSRGWGLNTLCYRWRLGQGHCPPSPLTAPTAKPLLSVPSNHVSLIAVVWPSSGICLRAKIICDLTELPNETLTCWDFKTNFLLVTFAPAQKIPLYMLWPHHGKGFILDAEKHLPVERSMFAFWQHTAFTQTPADTSIKNGFMQSQRLDVTISGAVPNTEDILP